MKNPSTLYIVRHSETERNVQEVLNGQQDSELTKNGIEQAKALCREFENIYFDAIYSSDLKRAKKTADIIKGTRPNELQTEPMLRERYYGKFEGQPKSIYKEELEKTLAAMNDFSDEARWKARPSTEVESRDKLIQRFTKAIKNIAKRHPNNKILVVTHGACISNFLIYLGIYKIGELPIGSFGNCGYVQLVCDGKKFEVLSVKGVKKQV